MRPIFKCASSLVAGMSLLLLGGSLSGCAQHSRGAYRSDDAGILQMMHLQVEAWNHGDIEGFMQAYIPTPRLRFAGASGVQRGWLETLTRYQAAYPNRAAMGKLSFENLEITPLSPQHAEVFGQYFLHRGGAYQDATGFFTLLVERTPAGWRIVHDHTSAMP